MLGWGRAALDCPRVRRCAEERPTASQRTWSPTSRPPAESREPTRFRPTRAARAALGRYAVRDGCRAASRPPIRPMRSTRRRRSTSTDATSRGRPTSVSGRSPTNACVRWTCRSGSRRSSVKTRGKPWAYYNDLSRQLWDEARHAMMGEVCDRRAGRPVLRVPHRLGFLGVAESRVHPARGPHRPVAHRAGTHAGQAPASAASGSSHMTTATRSSRGPAGLRLGGRGAARADRQTVARGRLPEPGGADADRG